MQLLYQLLIVITLVFIMIWLATYLSLKQNYKYWYRKIKKEILYHSRSIEQIREDKLKQLLK